MRCEIPAPTRCCFCIPLRIGLLIAGYIKFILSLLYLLYNSFRLHFSIDNLHFSEHYALILIFIFEILNNIVDIVFQLIFLIAAHKKDYRKIRMYYRYSIYNIIAIIIILCVNMSIYLNLFIIFFFLNYMIFLAIIFLWTLVIQIYLMILVRSEFLKLKGNTQFQFVNNDAEAQCSATIKISGDDDEVDIDTEMDYDKLQS